jgi:hypothetical protein
LEELLIIALEVLFEHDALDVRTFLHQPLSRPEVRSIELRIVREFSLPCEPIVKHLRRLVVAAAM